MAEWKKLVVSGSDISQLNNDAGYITSATAGHAFTTASFDGTNLLADSSNGTLNFASGSGQGLTIAATAGTDTLTFGLDAIPNSSLANEKITIGTTDIALGQSGTILVGLTSVTSTSFTGSLNGNADTATAVGNSLTDGNGIADFTFDGSAATTVSVQADGSTLAVGASGVKVADAGITATQLNASVAGDGLAGGAGTALSVNVDDSTIEIDTDTLRVKDGGITFTKLAAADVIDATETIASNKTEDGKIATVKAIADYVDSQVGAATLNISGSTGNDAIDLNDEDLTFAGESGVVTADVTANTVTINLTDGGISNAKLTNDSIKIGDASFALGTTASLASTGFNSGSFSGSFEGDGSGLTGLVSSLSTEGDSGTGTVDLLTQTLDIAGGSNITTTAGAQTITVALNDDINVTNATVTGDLVVQGTASFQHETNLEVADRFILLASGSATTGDGGIIVQQATQDVGDVFGFDGVTGADRWGIGQVQNAASSSFTPEAFMAAVLTGDADSDTAIQALVDNRYNAKGNIFIADDEGIWIFS